MKTTTITHTTAAEAETLWVIRDRVTFLGAVPGSGLSLLEVEVPPGSGTPPHCHASAEVFRVLSGEVTFGMLDAPRPRFLVGGAGTVVRIPSNAPHSYQNRGSGPARMLVVVEQAMVDFFRDLGRREVPSGGPPGEDELAAVMAACARHRIQILPADPQ